MRPRRVTSENEIIVVWPFRILHDSIPLPRETPLTWAAPRYAPTITAANRGGHGLGRRLQKGTGTGEGME